MKVVLHVLAMNSFSGAENVVITLIRGFRQQGYPHRFIYASPDGPIRQIVEENGIEFAPIKKLRISEIRRLIRTYRPDVIHAHDFSASTICAFSAGRTPVISHIHNNPIWLRKVCARTIAYGLSCFKHQALLGVSPAVFNEFIFGRLFRQKARVIGNPIEFDRIRQLSAQAETKQAFDVVFLGRLMPEKNPMLFLRVIEELRSFRPETAAVMIGDGELRPELEQYIHKHDLQRNISLTGFLPNPYGILSSSKILCMTSAWEGYGLAAVEALALGRPVVASPVGGIPTIITGNEGILCKDALAFVNSLLRLLTEPDEYRMRSKAALQRAAELDNMDVYIRTLADLYG